MLLTSKIIGGRSPSIHRISETRPHYSIKISCNLIFISFFANVHIWSNTLVAMIWIFELKPLWQMNCITCFTMFSENEIHVSKSNFDRIFFLTFNQSSIPLHAVSWSSSTVIISWYIRHFAPENASQKDRRRFCNADFYLFKINRYWTIGTVSGFVDPNDTVCIVQDQIFAQPSRHFWIRTT